MARLKANSRSWDQVELPLVRNDQEHLALAKHARVLPALTVQANFVPDRFHRHRDLVGDLQSARQHGQGGG